MVMPCGFFLVMFSQQRSTYLVATLRVEIYFPVRGLPEILPRHMLRFAPVVFSLVSVTSVSATSRA